MPFTFAHPAIVLPLWLVKNKKKWFSLTGLIAGSMSPDFEYFFRMNLRGEFGHTIAGMFLFDLPAALLIAVVFHQVIKQPLVLHLPLFLRARFQIFANENWLQYFKRNFLVVSVSVLIGAASHIFWDGFTHYDGWFVKHFPALLYMEIAGFPLYKILQHVSSIAGLLIIALVIFSLPKQASTQQNIMGKYKFWLLVFVLSGFVLSVYFLQRSSFPTFGNLLVACISSGFIGLLVTSFLYRKNKI